MKLLRKVSQALLIVPVLALALSAVVPALPAYAGIEGGVLGGADSAKGDDQSGSLFEEDGVFKQVTEALLFLIGAVSVIMLIIGGFRYTTSNGNAESVTKAKNTILYSIVGILIALLSYAAVQWVASSFSAN